MNKDPENPISREAVLAILDLDGYDIVRDTGVPDSAIIAMRWTDGGGLQILYGVPSRKGRWKPVRFKLNPSEQAILGINPEKSRDALEEKFRNFF